MVEETTLKIDEVNKRSDPANITKPQKISHFSLYGSSKDFSIQLDDSNARYFDQSLLPASIGIDLSEDIKNYVPRDQPFNRIDPLLVWCMKAANCNKMSLEEVTQKADFVVDRSTLSKLAMIPYETNSYGQMIHVCRLDDTIFMCPYRVKEEADFYDSPSQMKFSYTREKLRDLITVGSNNNNVKDRPADGNIVFQHVNTAIIASTSSKFKLLYAGQVDILENNHPLEIRIQTGKLGQGTNWQTKAMKWYFQSVFLGAEQFLVGVRPRGKECVESFKKFPSEKIRIEAEMKTNNWWNREKCLGFLNEVLKIIHKEAKKLPETAALIVTHKPYSNELKLSIDWKNENNFLTYEFLHQFGYTKLLNN